MRRLACIFLVILLLAGLAATVSAQSGARDAHSQLTVNADGSCRVMLTMTLVLDSGDNYLTYPLPQGATDVTVNGQPASLTPGGGISLSGITGGAGRFSITISYLLSNALTTLEEGMLLTLPLLGGFSYPIEDFSFTIRLPGETLEKPTFESGYHQQTIIEHMTITQTGDTIEGHATAIMKDHETLTMTLPVTEAMFPQSAQQERVLELINVFSFVLMGLACVYFILLMRPRFLEPAVRTTAPDGLPAGEVGQWLTGQSMDFTLLVLSWAQMGYLRIEVKSPTRVLLHKRMEMGNERSTFENKYYRSLFGRRTTVEGTGGHYARLTRHVSRQAGRLRDVYAGSPIHILIFRVICTLAAILSGVILAGGFASAGVGLRIFLGLVTGLLAWLIQEGAGHILLRQRIVFWLGVAAGVTWFVLGLFAGGWLAAGIMILLQSIAGLAAAFGGRRTQPGQQNLSQLLDLWLHFLLSPKENLLRLMKVNPNYFYNLAPYALAMNADRNFARRFGRMHLPECAYLTDGRNRQLTAAQWNELLRKTVNALDAKAKRLPFEQLFGK